MTRAEQGAGLRLLAQLARANVPLVRVVALMPGLCSEAWRSPSLQLRRRVSAGERLSAALAAVVPDLPVHIVAIIHAGEAGGALAPALERAAADAERADQQQRELLQALSYPLLLLASGMICVLIVTLVVLPQFETILADLGQQLPNSAEVLLTLVRIGPAVLLTAGVLLALVVCIGVAQRSQPLGRRKSDELLFRTPLLGSQLRLRAVERLCNMLQSLLECGVSIPRALVLASRATSNSFLAHGLGVAREEVVRGQALSVSLQRAAVVPENLGLLIRVGEETGTLPSSLGQVARLARERSDTELRRTIKLIEPTVLVTVALFVGAVAATLMQTIYSVRPST